jgi:hypothetical protein
MTTWPSATKASTTHVDAGTDQISLARADIKQNIDNVNDIIDIFNIASPTNGDLMQYNSSTTKWEKVSATSVSTKVKFATLTIKSGVGAGVGIVGGGFRLDIIAKSDADNMITLLDVDSAGEHARFSLAPGTYGMHTQSLVASSGNPEPILYNVTAAQIFNGSLRINHNFYKVLSATTTLEFRIDNVNNNSGLDNFNFIKYN